MGVHGIVFTADWCLEEPPAASFYLLFRASVESVGSRFYLAFRRCSVRREHIGNEPAFFFLV